jgi:glycosyltransferase involved in cell wall biosynthesis
MSGRGAIAFFLPSLAAGGAERVTLNLAQGIIERGLPVDLVLATADGPFSDQLPPSVRVVNLGTGRVLRSLLPLIRYLRRERPRVLFSQMDHANIVALWAGRLAGQNTPVIVTVHNTMSQANKGGGNVWWPPLLRTFYPWAAAVVAVSRGVADDLARTAGLPRHTVDVVYNPVIMPGTMAPATRAPDHPWFAPGQPPVIVGVGRLTRQKDFPNLIRAFARVRQTRPAHLIILGEGEERSALDALIAQLGLTHDVALPGYRENATAYIAASAVFVLSSAWEGLPTVLIEALAVGARVISTDCPSGPREILQDGRLGTLVEVGNVTALANAIIDALDRPADPVPTEALAPFTRDAAVDHYLRLLENA